MTKNITSKSNGVTILSVYPATKAEQQAIASDIADAIVDGKINPLEGICKLKALKDTCEIALKDKGVVDAVLTEADKYGKNEQISYNGAKINIRETGVKYDYSMCGDQTLIDLYAQRDEIVSKIKEREEWLQSVPLNGFEYADPNTGEMVKLYRPAKSSTTSFAITFKK